MVSPIPVQIANYFSAKDSFDAALLDACLAPEVVVEDMGEGDRIEGAGKVKEWIKGIHEQFALSTSISAWRRDGEVIVVETMVKGDFPGSPLPFTYRFTLKREKIANIVIVDS